MKRKSPKIAKWLLDRAAKPEEKVFLAGDLEEEYNEIAKAKGLLRARAWYWRHVLNSSPTFLKFSIFRGAGMFKSYAKVTLRNMRRFKLYSFINLSGLSVGMVSFFLISLYAHDELHYETFHENADRIYQLGIDFSTPGNNVKIATSSYPMGEALKRDYEEITDVVRMRKMSNTVVSYEGNRFYEEHFYYAEANIFEVFNFDLIEGDRLNALGKPATIILTESSARKYFGDANPVGKVLRINNDTDSNKDYTVTAVAKNIPQNTHLKFDFLAVLDENREQADHSFSRWVDLQNMYTYLLLNDDVRHKDFEEKISGFVGENIGEMLDQYSIDMTPDLIPVKEIHFDNVYGNQLGERNSRVYVYTLFAVGFIILLTACINFMNLATSRSIARSKEVGVRKVLGAFRVQLIKQYLIESLFYSLISLMLSVILVKLALPIFNELVNRELVLDFSQNFETILYLVITSLFVGLLSGSYPAFLLSSFNPVKIFHDKSRSGSLNNTIRKTLVITQFSASVVLIICTIILGNQLDYFTSKDLGFNAEQILVLSLSDDFDASNYETFKNELLQQSSVLSASVSNTTPGTNRRSGTLFGEQGASESERKILYFNSVDFDYVDTYGLTVNEGRSFSKEITTDRTQAIMVNEMLVKEFGWKNPVGMILNHYGRGETPLEVIGVIRDYHFASLQTAIIPTVLRIDPSDYQSMSIRIRPENVSETISAIGNVWERFSPAYPLEYSFVNENFAKSYVIQERFGSMFRYFSLLAIGLACMGLFGLASFIAEQKTKEIGIRKVLGSTVSGVMLLLSKEFVKWVLIANIFAWPIAYYVMDNYLEEFAFRIDIGLPVFIFAGMIALAIALVTVSYHAVKSAFANPVQSLRIE